MHGDLRTTSLEELCRALDAGRESGELTIDGGDTQIRVWFQSGRVVRATASRHELRLGDRLVHGGLLTTRDLRAALRSQEGTGRHLGEILVQEGLVSRHVVRAFMQEQVLDALFAAVRWTVGTYSFTPTKVSAAAVPTDLTVQQLLFALETRHRLWDEITRSVPALDRVPAFAPGADPGSVSFEPGEQAVVDSIDGRRSVEELAEDLGFGSYEVASIVHGLTVLGMVRLLGADDLDAAAATPSRDAVAVAASVGEAPSSLHADANGAGAPSNGVAPPLQEAPPVPPAGGDTSADDDEPTFVIMDDDLDDPTGPTSSASTTHWASEPSAQEAMSSRPTFLEPDDDGPEPWAFVIDEGDQAPGGDAPPPRPRSDPQAPITSRVASTSTGTPLPPPSVPTTEAPSATPAPAPVRDPEPAASASDPTADAPSEADEAPPEATAPAPQRARKTGEMTDLLRELRQLSDE